MFQARTTTVGFRSDIPERIEQILNDNFHEFCDDYESGRRTCHKIIAILPEVQSYVIIYSYHLEV